MMRTLMLIAMATAIMLTAVAVHSRSVAWFVCDVGMITMDGGLAVYYHRRSRR